MHTAKAFGRMELIKTQDAEADLEYWKRSGNKKALKKLEQLFTELMEHPKTGTGKPEELKHNLSGFYSRHIIKKDRLVYEIKEEQGVVVVYSMRGHYLDK